MKERKQKRLALANHHQQMNSTECDRYDGVQTFMGIESNNLVEVVFTEERVLEYILTPVNLNRSYQKVVFNKGVAGVDGMAVEELLLYLKEHKEELLRSLEEGLYRPQPVLRVEIPKDEHSTRSLGIPTVVDRLIQQAISTFLTSLYDKTFSLTSYGFRPRRSAHDAIRKVESLSNAGYEYVVDLYLEKFFDTVNHSKLIQLLSTRIKDGRVISLIHRFLRSGVVVNGKFEKTNQGLPQGSPLSPLLSNIMLNELDKELDKRGLKYVRYADDCMILSKSKRSAERIMSGISKFIETNLYLKVNQSKTSVGYLRGKKFLGYSFYKWMKVWKISAHPKSLSTMKSKLKSITSRSNGWSYEKLKTKLKSFIVGWVDYFYLANMKSHIEKIDEWLRRRIRMCIWKRWKRVRTKFANLKKCGIHKNQAWQWANTRKGYWRISDSWILHRAINTEKLQLSGYPSLKICFGKYYRK